jgi:hypothetical protein
VLTVSLLMNDAGNVKVKIVRRMVLNQAV